MTDTDLSLVLLYLRAEDGPAAALVYSPGAPGGYEVWTLDPDETLPPDDREAT